MRQHTRTAVARRRRFPVLVTVATVLGVWFGLSAPDTSPAAPPPPATQAATATDPVDPSTPVTPVAPGAGRGGGRR